MRLQTMSMLGLHHNAELFSAAPDCHLRRRLLHTTIAICMIPLDVTRISPPLRGSTIANDNEIALSVDSTVTSPFLLADWSCYPTSFSLSTITGLRGTRHLVTCLFRYRSWQSLGYVTLTCSRCWLAWSSLRCNSHLYLIVCNLIVD